MKAFRLDESTAVAALDEIARQRTPSRAKLKDRLLDHRTLLK
jgi:hypothetical protein